MREGVADPGRAGSRRVAQLEASTARRGDPEIRDGIGSGARRGRVSVAASLDGPRGADRPSITITSELAEVVDQACHALASDERIFQRDGRLAHVVRVAQTETDALSRAGTPEIRELPSATLRERLTKVADWFRAPKQRGGSTTGGGEVGDVEGTRGGMFRVPGGVKRGGSRGNSTLPTDPVVHAVRARGEWSGIRPLTGIIETPSITPKGRLIDSPGYDRATGYLYVPTIDFPVVPAHPTQEKANRALVELCEPFQDFPFESDAARLVPIAALLTLLARPAILGACPGFVIDAPTRGTGKTLMADVIATIATGRGAARMSWPHDEAELEKCLGAYALRGAAIVCFDNVARRFGGGPLDKCLTAADTVDLRVLGRSEIPTIRWRAVVLATGNNLELGGDTARRVLLSRLQSPLEHPELRHDFKLPRLLAWVTQERPRLVGAALTLLRAYVVAGHPDMDLGTWGSFEAWVDLIPRAIAFAGGASVLAARAVVSGVEEPEKRALATILQEWGRFAPEGATLNVAIQRLYAPARVGGGASDEGFGALREALEDLAPAQPGQAPDARKLGHAFRRLRGRVVAGRRLEAADSKVGGRQRWRVQGCG